MDAIQKKEQQPVSPGAPPGVMERVGEPPRVPEELQKLGVEPVSPEPQLTPVHEQAGIRLAGAAVPPSITPEGLVELPLSREETKMALKISDLSNALRWLAKWVERQRNKLNQRGMQEAYAG